jgi:glycosyltransferase involved in cell wall biosynthesis
MAPAKRTIVFTHPYFTALPDAVTHTVGQLVFALAEEDVPVAVLCLADGKAPRDLPLWEVPTFGLPVTARWTRPILQVWYLLAAIALTVSRVRGLSCVVTVDTPSGIGLAGLAAKAISRGRTSHICWVLDLVGDQIEELQYRGPFWILHGIRRKLDNYPYRFCDVVVTLGECMRSRLVARHVTHAIVIPQWQDSAEVVPRPTRDAKRKFGLVHRFVVLYSGNADIRHPLRAVVDAATELHADPDVLFALVGRSQVLRQVEASARRRGLLNVVRRDPVPLADVSDLLSAGDVHLVSLARRATGTCVPSKAYSAMAVARPVIFLGDGSSQVALDIREAGAGYVLDPEDTDGILEAIKLFRSDHEHAAKVGEAGYSFFKKHRDLRLVTAAWKELFIRMGAM